MGKFKDAIKEELKRLTKLKEIPLEMPPNQELGDYAFPCFILSKEMKKSPNDIAQELCKKVELKDPITEVRVNGPYLNFFINKSLFAKEVLTKIAKEKGKYGSGKKKKEKVMVEFPAPNTNKPLHLGHIRNMLLGECLSRVLEFNGFKVIRTNLNNDRGVHICKSMLAYERWGNNKEPDKKSDHFVGDFYILYNQKVKENPELENEIQEMLKKWEEGDKKIVAIWKKMNNWAISGFNETYKLFGIRFDKVYNESEHYKEAKNIVTKAYEDGLLEKDENGNIIAKLGKFNMPDKVLLRADGTSVYMTQDINLAKLKFDDFKMQRSIYIVGSEQNLHFKQLFAVLNILGFNNVDGCYHLSYGMVYLPEGKMKSREGAVVDADNLVGDMAKLAKEEIVKRHELDGQGLKERSKQIGMAALNFFVLKYEPSKDIHFNPEESLNFDGETGPYIQYSHARICSILRKVDVLPQKADFKLLSEKEELKLITLVSQFPETINQAAMHYRPHLIARYLLDLSQAFNEYYHAHQILNSEHGIRDSRLLLITCIKQVLENGLKLLNIEAPEKM